ncbi:putative hydrolase of the HAD superfamily [Novosphingobium hassiacum]|uniref:Putative hydrolase of the HAD superfamily n=1 Tax=Novosphingobium hassiacum TaxID=173676 RepID=A0A7W5ZUI8_9SPHN|nr:pyrimidine 5'-nucleotidase [Novosphingobium hassiacum]MBB3860213.1 putative hydrolase of the HAD superfamily [Novosphingobium hassiacum]
MPFDATRVDCWIFDLDNTLYPPSTRLFDQIDIRMGEFIENLLGCDSIEARRVQKLYFHDHGTTLSGLMHYHAIDPHEFLGFVHDIDMTPLAAAPRLAPKLAALPGRKLVFTNGDDAYAGRVLQALDLSDSFDGMWDIHAMNYRPKPEPSAYSGMIEALDIRPETAVFVEDMARNLAPAKALGMQTVWLDLATEWGDRAKDDAAIDLVIDDIAQWLDTLADNATLG